MWCFPFFFGVRFGLGRKAQEEKIAVFFDQKSLSRGMWVSWVFVRPPDIQIRVLIPAFDQNARKKCFRICYSRDARMDTYIYM